LTDILICKFFRFVLKFGLRFDNNGPKIFLVFAYSGYETDPSYSDNCAWYASTNVSGKPQEFDTTANGCPGTETEAPADTGFNYGKWNNYTLAKCKAYCVHLQAKGGVCEGIDYRAKTNSCYTMNFTDHTAYGEKADIRGTDCLKDGKCSGDVSDTNCYRAYFRMNCTPCTPLDEALGFSC
jgi:hypothetical protein